MSKHIHPGSPVSEELRLKALNAFMTHPDLSHTARRVGSVLLAMMSTREDSFKPTEVRVAGELGLDIRALQRAKIDLKAAGLLTWTTPKGPRGGAVYRFQFDELERVHAATERRVKAAVRRAK